MSEEVYMAMVARGYTGNTRTLATVTAAADRRGMGARLRRLAFVVLGVDRALG